MTDFYSPDSYALPPLQEDFGLPPVITQEIVQAAADAALAEAIQRNDQEVTEAMMRYFASEEADVDITGNDSSDDDEDAVDDAESELDNDGNIPDLICEEILYEMDDLCDSDSSDVIYLGEYPPTDFQPYFDSNGVLVIEEIKEII